MQDACVERAQEKEVTTGLSTDLTERAVALTTVSVVFMPARSVERDGGTRVGTLAPFRVLSYF